MSGLMFYKETARLILRAPKAEDAAVLAEKRSTPYVMRYNLYRPCDAAQILRELEMYEHIILERKADGCVIGCVSVREDHMRYGVDSRLLQAWLAEEYASCGYMTEALSCVIDYAFESMELNRIEAQHELTNPSSGRVMEKCGMRKEGELRQRLFNKGKYVDVALYAILRSDPRPKR